MQIAGIPDLIGCYKGRFVGIEVKTPENKAGATKLQMWFIRQIIKAGGIAFVARSWETVESELNKIV